jgi:hypothetical protein
MLAIKVLPYNTTDLRQPSIRSFNHVCYICCSPSTPGVDKRPTEDNAFETEPLHIWLVTLSAKCGILIVPIELAPTQTSGFNTILQPLNATNGAEIRK